MSEIVQRLQAVLPERIDFNAKIPHYTLDGPVTVVSDLHIPLLDEHLFDRMIEAADAAGSNHIFIVGDMFDMAPFSKHPIGLGSKQQVLSNVRDVGHLVLEILAEQFDNIFISTGNHDSWFVNHMEGHLGMTDLIRWVYPEGGEYQGGVGTGPLGQRIYVNELPTCFVTIAGEEWVFEHPGSYSRVRTNTARLTAERYGKHAAVGHVHHWGMTVSNNGQHYAVDLAGLYNPRYFDFPKERPKNMPEMVSGFVILGEGEPKLFKGISS